jgi:hypothetical protein
MPKVEVMVNADFTLEGVVIPLAIKWEDGREFGIDRVIDIRRAASLKAGGVGLRYTIEICGKQTYMWLQDDLKWFVEGK